ncbi:hypothetical protein FBR01_13095 [Anaerolineae bacterium CFX8]|nr:hypothetical protein [Anaerolineae bacterium CFX8]
MTQLSPPGVSQGRPLIVWGLCCALAGAVFLVYTFAGLAAGRGEPVMPLDDVYIHFQYAKQLAAGQPYVYNPGLPPSSGATSFLYPFILAAGYLLGFQGLNLGLWAMGIGALALAVSAWLVYRLARAGGAPERLAIALVPIFTFNGAVSWHFMSGMETGLVVLFTLWVVYALTSDPLSVHGEEGKPRFWQIIITATLLALIRPEGAILTLLAVGAAVLQWRLTPPPVHGVGEQRRFIRMRYVVFLLPLLAIGVQPLVNLLVTGSAMASGNAAKSVFGIVPFEWGEAVRRIIENFARMWGEFFTGTSPREGMYILPGMLLLAAVGLVCLVRARHASSLRSRVFVALVILGWLVVGTLAVSTLDTAFWHFKRYQMPFVALLFPLAGWGTAVLSPQSSVLRRNQRQVFQILAGVLSIILLASSLWMWPQFLHHYALNVSCVYLQPLQMARWLQANTPPDAVIAVHDTGLLRYEGERTTIDMVGLTTPGAADYWRSGPGAVAEFLMNTRPDYIAAYGPGHGFGLSMIADTNIYGAPLAEFPVTLDDRYNVALAAGYQGIYRPEWESSSFQNTYKSLQPSSFIPYGLNELPSSSVNVADLKDEARANYRWRSSEPLVGFPTEVHELGYVSCIIENCVQVDGVRRISSEETFDLYTGYSDSGSAWDITLVTRLQPAAAGTLDIYANGKFVGTRWIPAIPGRWLEVATVIPRDIAGENRLTSNTVNIRIVPHVAGGFYMPAYHWIYGAPTIEAKPETEIITYQSGAIVLAAADIDYRPGAERMGVNFEWYTDGSARGDYIVFVHLYEDVNQPPAAQTDIRPGGGVLPPGNWLPGVLRDIIWVDVKDVPPGKYQAAIGFYDPFTFERLPPDGGRDEDGRLFIGEVEIE